MRDLALDPPPRSVKPVFEQEVAAAGAAAGEGDGGSDQGMPSDLNPSHIVASEKTRLASGSRVGPASMSATDSGLVSVVVSRLTRVEAQNAELKDKLCEKDAAIAVLRRKIAELEAGAAAADGQSSLIAGLQDENARLRKHISEIDGFLADYGLIWVGDGSDSDDDDDVSVDDSNDIEPGNEGGDHTGGEATPPPVVFPFDLTVLLARFKHLNYVAGDGTAEVVASSEHSRGGRLAQVQAIDVTLYANGLIMARSGTPADDIFRSFAPHPETGVSTAYDFLADVFDGYFPSELQERYPDGVPFDVTPRTTEVFTPKLEVAPFSGAGRSADGSVVVSGQNGVGSRAADRQVGAAEFLARLPERVVRDGKVHAVRSDVAQLLQVGGSGKPGSPSDVIVVPTLILKELEVANANVPSSATARPSSAKAITTLRVKSPRRHAQHCI
ncbi:UBX domain-containing protein 11 [Thecamonas trahens ATCC 50062]|uniref:UBX domain-containing protein 11 n=1 Tax=Thecamonas trahens ATCC 50062 TaxID=461836 RepID=A0A0L0D9Q9_THETB|nr:UBX domain-containing protein 11 [Thecamonas trahens ATCC 50062]KNC49082.1 UBX domain-containing protein 11 [Thecamonas trahens ATCC 50062]|eukprot:XP_013758113.1 UBX domain-containing protein 11 [Thecamonas trahens ATCC 50062]